MRRPSRTIQTRGYVEKTDLEGTEREVQTLGLDSSVIGEEEVKEITGADRSKLVPTAVADVTTDFLVKYFPSIVDFDFTAKVEDDFDQVAEGKQTWNKMIADFYKDFHPLVEKPETSLAPKSARPAYSASTQDQEANPSPLWPLRPDAAARRNRRRRKARFRTIARRRHYDTVTFEQALEMFKLPRTVGTTEDGQEIKANIGRFGPYIQVEKIFVSIKPQRPVQITEAEARELYKAKLEKDAKNTSTNSTVDQDSQWAVRTLHHRWQEERQDSERHRSS